MERKMPIRRNRKTGEKERMERKGKKWEKKGRNRNERVNSMREIRDGMRRKPN